MPCLVFSINFFKRLRKSSGWFFLICIVSILTRRYRGGKLKKLFHTVKSAFNAFNMSLSIIKPDGDISGNTARPASVIRPDFSILRQRSLFNSDHREFFYAVLTFGRLLRYRVFSSCCLSIRST